jgi:hypothetical protein
MDILQSIASTQKNVEAINARLFDVIDFKVPTPSPADLGLAVNIDVQECPTHLIYNSKGAYFGEVKGSYESLQPKDFFNTILSSAHECGAGLNLDKMTYEEYKNGQIVNFKIPTEMIVFKNRAQKIEEVELFVNFETGFGGVKSTNIGLFSKRFICSNGMRIIESELQLTARHTKRKNAEVLLWCDELSQVIANQERVSNIWQAMDKIDISKESINKFLHQSLKLPKHLTIEEAITNANKDISTQKCNILNSMCLAMDEELSRTGQSVYGFIQGVTNYTNNYASGKSDEYVNIATGATTNSEVQRFAMSLM